jgi:hypothetical protein
MHCPGGLFTLHSAGCYLAGLPLGTLKRTEWRMHGQWLHADNLPEEQSND